MGCLAIRDAFPLQVGGVSLEDFLQVLDATGWHFCAALNDDDVTIIYCWNECWHLQKWVIILRCVFDMVVEEYSFYAVFVKVDFKTHGSHNDFFRTPGDQRQDRINRLWAQLAETSSYENM